MILFIIIITIRMVCVVEGFSQTYNIRSREFSHTAWDFQRAPPRAAAATMCVAGSTLSEDRASFAAAAVMILFVIAIRMVC